jgi:enterochelin esterase-like enzyme
MQDAIDWAKFEVSDPQYERDGLRNITVKSGHLRGRGDISVFLPPQAATSAAPLPVVVLLHGVYGSHWAWTLKGGAHRTAQRLLEEGAIPPMVLAMPSDGLWGDGTAYLEQQRANYERWIATDVPAAVASILPPPARGGPLFLSGLSMGGYAALRIGAKYGAKTFRAVSAMSSATRLDRMMDFVSEKIEDAGFLDSETSVLDVILARRNRLPALRFDCGTQDILLQDNRDLHTALDRTGIPHAYQENPGGHDWLYWQKHLADTLRFFASHAGHSPPPAP